MNINRIFDDIEELLVFRWYDSLVIMILYKGSFLVFSDLHWYIYRWNYVSEICFTIIWDGEAESRWDIKETGLATTDHEAGDGIFFSV